MKFTLDVVDVETGASLGIPLRRQKGGAFEVRGLAPLQGEMEAAEGCDPRSGIAIQIG